MRSGSFDYGVGLGEPELDANSALTELDKGLRSLKLGEQVEAIVRFPSLFERYPFPILINSAFLKLADVFRAGSNFLRLWVLRVCQQSERHLDKILNVDEFVRRIFSVIYSNDPIARALTLRTLGSLSGLIPEKKKIHHSIRVGLDSNDRVEVLAAIYAASKFAQKSKTFGTTMSMKISSMVQRLSTPVDLKLRLIPIFRHMHHDVETAQMVRKLGVELLMNYPSQQFVITILHTLTQLAASTVTDLTDQVSFLLTHLEDSRAQVKIRVLRDLRFLGKKGGHLWEAGHISTLIDLIMKNKKEGNNEDDDDESMEVDVLEEDQRGQDQGINHLQVEIGHAGLDVIEAITSSLAILSFLQNQNSPLFRLLDQYIHSNDTVAALKAIQITTNLAVNWNRSHLGPEIESQLLSMASGGLESLLNSLVYMEEEADSGSYPEEGGVKETKASDLEKCLACGVVLIKADFTKCDWFSTILIRLFKVPRISARSRNLIVQAIGAVGSQNLDSLVKVVPDILSVLKKLDTETVEKEGNTVATLIALIFQAHQGHTLHSKTLSVIHNTLKLSKLWLAYRVTRHSLRYSQPETASLILGEMKSKVASENFHHWLSALHSVARAESLLSENGGLENKFLIQQIRKAQNLYLQAVSTMRASSSPSASLQFQIEYVRLRSEMLVAFSNLLISCNTLQLSPPAEIATNLATMMRDELLKSGRVVTQLRKCIREFQNIGEMYGRLYQSAFDADNDSLLNIQILQQLCLFMARIVEKQVVSRDHPSFSAGDSEALTIFNGMTYQNTGNSWNLILSVHKVNEILEGMKSLPSGVVTPKHVDSLREIVRVITGTPLPFPRYFFQTLQMTKVKIAVTPQPRNMGECVSVLAGNQLALKVEGVIQQNSESGVFRKPKAIRLTVTTQPLPNPRMMHIMDQMKIQQEPTTTSKDITPHRDFFQGQFLLQIAAGGLTNVAVDTSLVDFEGRIWLTGIRATLSVRGLDEGGSKGSGNIVAAATLSIPGPSAGPSTSAASSSSRPHGNYGPSLIAQRH